MKVLNGRYRHGEPSFFVFAPFSPQQPADDVKFVGKRFFCARLVDGQDKKLIRFTRPGN